MEKLPFELFLFPMLKTDPKILDHYLYLIPDDHNLRKVHTHRFLLIPTKPKRAPDKCKNIHWVLFFCLS